MSLRVLLVDDEAEFLETLCKRLARREVEAFTASSGEAALAFLTADEVDVVVLDVKMPGMDGIETLKRSSCSPATPAWRRPSRACSWEPSTTS